MCFNFLQWDLQLLKVVWTQAAVQELKLNETVWNWQKKKKTGKTLDWFFIKKKVLMVNDNRCVDSAAVWQCSVGFLLCFSLLCSWIWIFYECSCSFFPTLFSACPHDLFISDCRILSLSAVSTSLLQSLFRSYLQLFDCYICYFISSIILRVFLRSYGTNIQQQV